MFSTRTSPFSIQVLSTSSWILPALRSDSPSSASLSLSLITRRQWRPYLRHETPGHSALIRDHSPSHVHLDLRPGHPRRHDPSLLEPGHLCHQVIKLVLDPLERPALHDVPRLHQEVHQPLLLRYNDALIINSLTYKFIRIKNILIIHLSVL